MESRQKTFWPVLTLFFLAPAIGELLSGSSPPTEFFNPFGLFLMAAIYGSGAILIRELRVRWNKGWPTVLALAAAYGIVEEGLACKSFFDPNWADLGPLGVYGRWAGVNWVWSLDLTIYHAVISITIPILLVELLFPAQRNKHWLGRRGMIGFSLLLAADVLFLFFVISPYYPPPLHILLTSVVVVALFLLARRLPKPNPISTPKRVPRPLWFAVLGFVAMLIFFLIIFLILPELAIPVPLTLLVTFTLIPLMIWGVHKMSYNEAWNDEHRGALAAGALMFFILLTPIQEFDQARLDNTAGMTIVGLVSLICLIWLWRRVRVRVRGGNHTPVLQ